MILNELPFIKRKRFFQFISTLIIVVSLNSRAGAQEKDTLVKAKNSFESESFHSPKKAASLSALFPGLGQAYNKKYWKMPIIYAGFIGLAYSFNYNQSKYATYRDAYKYRTDNDTSTTDNFTGIYRDDDLFFLQKTFSRYRDLAVIGASLLYILNILDASVDAHMFTFNVGDELSLNIQPTTITTASNHYQTGVSFKLKF